MVLFLIVSEYLCCYIVYLLVTALIDKPAIVCPFLFYTLLWVAFYYWYWLFFFFLDFFILSSTYPPLLSPSKNFFFNFLSINMNSVFWLLFISLIIIMDRYFWQFCCNSLHVSQKHPLVYDNQVNNLVAILTSPYSWTHMIWRMRNFTSRIFLISLMTNFQVLVQVCIWVPNYQ